jgi:hypothetical protein
MDTKGESTGAPALDTLFPRVLIGATGRDAVSGTDRSDNGVSTLHKAIVLRPVLPLGCYKYLGKSNLVF